MNAALEGMRDTMRARFGFGEGIDGLLAKLEFSLKFEPDVSDREASLKAAQTDFDEGLQGVSSLAEDGALRALADQNRKTAAWGIPFTALALTFAAIYWMKSLEYHWFSTMYGVWFFANCMRAALAFGVFITVWLYNRGDYKGIYNTNQFHCLTALAFALWPLGRAARISGAALSSPCAPPLDGLGGAVLASVSASSPVGDAAKARKARAPARPAAVVVVATRVVPAASNSRTLCKIGT